MPRLKSLQNSWKSWKNQTVRSQQSSKKLKNATFWPFPPSRRNWPICPIQYTVQCVLPLLESVVYMQNLSNHAASNCNTQKCQGLSNLHTKNWKLDWSFTPKSSTLSRCAQSARGPICRGPICRGPICRGPICRTRGPNCRTRGPNLPQHQKVCGPICLEPRPLAYHCFDVYLY